MCSIKCDTKCETGGKNTWKRFLSMRQSSFLPRHFEILLYNIQTSHLFDCPPMKDMQLSIWLLLLSVLTPAQQKRKNQAHFLPCQTSGLRPPLPLLPFISPKAATIYFLTFAGHFCCDPYSSSLFLEVPLSVCTSLSFFWQPRLRQQYKAGLA